MWKNGTDFKNAFTLNHAISASDVKVKLLLPNSDSKQELWTRLRVKGSALTFSHKNTKITTNCWTTINKKRLEPTKKDMLLPKEEATTKRQEGCLGDSVQSHTLQVGNPHIEE